MGKCIYWGIFEVVDGVGYPMSRVGTTAYESALDKSPLPDISNVFISWSTKDKAPWIYFVWGRVRYEAIYGCRI